MSTVLHVVGARPNFMKAAPVLRALGALSNIRQTLVHTGQHYDANMSDVFFEQLGIPTPDVFLGVGSGSHAAQTAESMVGLEKVVSEHQPDLVLVYGDVNSTVAATLVAAKLQVRVAHVEAGLRSFDRRMPEEINRLVTDRLADILFTPSADADRHLLAEGVTPERIYRVGNVMIDTLVRLLPIAKRPEIIGLSTDYALVTLHRPSNVDDPAVLEKILKTFGQISRDCQIVFPLHPRTRSRIDQWGLSLPEPHNCLFVPPIGYLECLALQRDARFVITDSGGIQEETTYLGIPCLTLRENTERPITVQVGTNVLVGDDMVALKWQVGLILSDGGKRGRVPELWDGQAAERIAQVVAAQWQQSRTAAVSPMRMPCAETRGT